MKKYMLHPGNVVSVTDGDVHFISAVRLAKLYHVPISECIVASHGYDDSRFIHLYPRRDGDYQVVSEKSK